MLYGLYAVAMALMVMLAFIGWLWFLDWHKPYQNGVVVVALAIMAGNVGYVVWAGHSLWETYGRKRDREAINAGSLDRL